MASVGTTIVKSVKLQAGESFTLPPGAQLIASTDIASITSTCEIPDLEALECYSFNIITNDTDTGDTHPWDEDEIEIYGVLVDGVEYLFPGGPVNNAFDAEVILSPPFIEYPNIGDLAAALKNVHGLFMGNISHTRCEVSEDRSMKNSICFQTIPSLAKNLFLIILPQWGGGFMYAKAVPASESTEICGGCTDCDSDIDTGTGANTTSTTTTTSSTTTTTTSGT